MNNEITGDRLIQRLKDLGQIGRDSKGRLLRLAASDEDKAGRDLLVKWMREADLKVEVDAIGNIFGTWGASKNTNDTHLIIGSHIDTVVDAGIYDGCYGVLSGIEVVSALKSQSFVPSRPLTVAAFTNEEGVRFTPDMMGSLVTAGGLSLEEALAAKSPDGKLLGAELKRIGYAGDRQPGFIKPFKYLEIHIEQGPILEKEKISIGAVEDLQGISWQEITIEGVANHAGTTPMTMRNDAGLAAARVITFLADQADRRTVATAGTIRFEPNAINIIPSKCVFTVDLRNPDEEKLKSAEVSLSNFLEKISSDYNVNISTQRLVRFQPVKFDDQIVDTILKKAAARNLSTKRMTSGAGHDAQMMARLCPSAMIFVPSVNGISHNPKEYTATQDLVNGANVLLDVVREVL